MKLSVRFFLLLSAAILAIVALCIPAAAGSYSSVPPGSTVECVFYWGGYYTYLETGEYMRVRMDTGPMALGGLSMFLVIVGAAYVLITLLPKLKAGKTAFLGGILILLGTIMYLPFLGMFEVEMEVPPWDDILIGSFAHFIPIPLILGLAAAALAIVGGILTWLTNRKTP
jgi:hypothetical protein